MSAQGIVQFDGASSAQTGTSTVSSLSWTSHAVASESNRMGVFMVAWKDQSAGGIGIIDATFNGVSVGGIIKTWQTSLNDIFLETYYLKTPAIGAHTVTITWSDTGATAVAGFVSCYNVHQQTGVGVRFPVAADSITSPIQNIETGAPPVPSTSLVLDFVTAFKAGSALALTVGADQTQSFNTESLQAGNHIIGASSYQRAIGGVADMSWTESINKEWASIAMELSVAPPILGASPAQFQMGR